MKRAVLIIAAALAGISLFLLTTASANTDFFAGAYPYLLGMNGAIAVGLAALVGVQLRSLWREYRGKQFGSRLKYRMLLMFALVAVLPGVVVYAVSMQFVVRSIDSWFDVRVTVRWKVGWRWARPHWIIWSAKSANVLVKSQSSWAMYRSSHPVTSTACANRQG